MGVCCDLSSGTAHVDGKCSAGGQWRGGSFLGSNDRGDFLGPHSRVGIIQNSNRAVRDWSVLGDVKWREAIAVDVSDHKLMKR